MNLRLSLLVGASLCLGGCEHLLFTPNPIPKGYTYTHDKYKTPPGPEADDIGYDYSAQKNAKVVDIWRTKAQKIVDSLENRAEISPKIVYVAQPKEHSPQNATFDFALRETLSKRGYILAQTPEDSITLSYEVENLDKPWDEYPYPILERRKENPDYNYVEEDFDIMRLILSLSDGKVKILELVEEHLVPSYGYEHEFDHQHIFGGVRGERHPEDPKPFLQQQFFQYDQ